MLSKYKKSIKVVSIADPNLMKLLDECELSVRSMTCLKLLGVKYLEELTALSRNDLLRTPNFGRKSLTEVEELLVQYGMSLGNGQRKDYLVINTINTFEVIPGKTYSRTELENFLKTKDIEFRIIPREIRNIERVNAVSELA